MSCLSLSLLDSGKVYLELFRTLFSFASRVLMLGQFSWQEYFVLFESVEFFVQSVL